MKKYKTYNKTSQIKTNNIHAKPEKRNVQIPVNWTLGAFGLSLPLKEGVKLLRKNIPQTHLKGKNSQQAKGRIVTEQKITMHQVLSQ